MSFDRNYLPCNIQGETNANILYFFILKKIQFWRPTYSRLHRSQCWAQLVFLALSIESHKSTWTGKFKRRGSWPQTTMPLNYLRSCCTLPLSCPCPSPSLRHYLSRSLPQWPCSNPFEVALTIFLAWYPKSHNWMTRPPQIPTVHIILYISKVQHWDRVLIYGTMSVTFSFS